MRYGNWLLLLALTLPCLAQTVYKQSAGAGNTVSNPATTTAADFSAANAIVIGIPNYNTSSCAVTPSSTPSNTWTALGSNIVNGTVNLCGWTCTIPCSVSASMTFTVTNSYPYIFVEGFSGAGSYSGYTSTTNSLGTCAPGTVTPTQANSAVVTVLADNSSTTATQPAGYTVQPAQNTTTSFMGKAMAYIITSTASVPAWAETATNQACFAVAVNATGGGGAVLHTLSLLGVGR